MNMSDISDVKMAAKSVSLQEEQMTPVHQMESLCMRCGENGVTRLLLINIPHFREVVLMAFECPHCNERNNEVQFAGMLQPHGCINCLEVPQGDLKVLNRQVVKSDSATIKIPELELEIPPEAQRGTLSTVEGILIRAADDLEVLQDERKRVCNEKADALDSFLFKLRSFAAGEVPFFFILDDPSGNSFIESTYAPAKDPLLTIKFYDRTHEQQEALGFLAEALSDVRMHAAEDENTIQPASWESMQSLSIRQPHASASACHAIVRGNTEEVASALSKYSTPEEVMMFPSTCGACGVRCETRMFITNIPYFREVIVMSSSCDACGYRSSELKPGGPIPAKGKRITVHVQTVEDLKRDVIKSDTASIKIPELDLELASGTLGGAVTTVEGLVLKICESLERIHGFTFGDSIDDWKRNKWVDFKSKLTKLMEVKEQWTLILDDALANSFVAPVTDNVEDDQQLVFEEYKRTWEQNEELGLNDMSTPANTE